MAFREKVNFGEVTHEGKSTFQVPLLLPIYTVAGLPAAADHPQELALVSDAEVGNVQRLVCSNGTDWLDIQTGVAVAA